MRERFDWPPLSQVAHWILGVSIVFLLMAITYSPFRDLNFCLADDPWMLLLNRYVNVKSYDFEYFSAIFTRINDIQYSPLNTLVYSLVYKINSFDPYYFHLFNIIVHYINSVLILILARKILINFDIEHSGIVSFIVFLLWSLHPMQIETIAWVSGSKILICSLLTLSSFLIFFNGLIKNNRCAYLFSSILFVLSCFCKEVGILIPFMWVLLTYCYKRKKSIGLRSKGFLFYFLVLNISLAISFGFFTLYSVNEVPTSNFVPIAAYPFYQRVILSFYCIQFYLTNFIFPVNLHYHYPFPVLPYGSMPVAFYIYPFAFFGLCYFLFFLIRRSKNLYYYILCLGIFLLHLSLELQVIPMTRPAIVADRYMYIPSFGLIMIFASLIINELYFATLNLKFRKFVLVLFAVYILYFVSYGNQLFMNWTNLNIIK